MCFKDKTLEDIKRFIESEIDFDGMVVNAGIKETTVLCKSIDGDGISIGVSFENSDRRRKPHYYYNVFVGPEYIDIDGEAVGRLDDRLPESVLILIRDTIAKFVS